MRLSRTVTSILAFALAALALPGAADATEAAATTHLNVRSGPGTAYVVVDTLAPGEIVEITECRSNGWCFITHPGPDGWVSSSYLTAAPGAGPAPSPDCGFRLTIGPDGPRFALVCGDDPGPGPAPGPGPGPSNRACFYDFANYGGASFCRGVGTINALPAAANDRMSSVRVFGNARVRLCVDPNLGGFCRDVVGNEAALGPFLNNRVSSLRVYTGVLPPPPPPPPVTYSTGPIDLPLNARANLDNGNVGASGADIWYRWISPVERRLAPVNGAMMARGAGTNRGFAGCSTESYSPAPLPLAALAVGTYVCVRTNAGRISQFRVNGYTPGAMRIGYTTWAY